MSSFSARVPASQQREKLSRQLLESFEKVAKIESSEQRRELLEDLRKLNETFPEQNSMDLMANHCSELVEFAKEEFGLILTEIVKKFGENCEEVPEEVVRFAAIADNAELVVETMNVLCTKAIQETPRFAANLSENLITDDSYLIFAFTRLSTCHDSDRFIQQLVSLPDKIANQLKSNFPQTFNPRTFSAIIMLNALKSLHVICQINKAEQSKVYDVHFLSKLISKVFVLFQGDKIVAMSSLRFLSCLSEIEECSESIRELLMCLQRPAVDVAAQLIFGNIEKQKIVAMIGDSWKSNSNWKFAILKKLPLFSFSTNDKIVDNLAFFLVNEDPKAAEGLLRELLAVWGTKSHINDTPFEQHFYVTKLIVLLTKHLPATENVRQLLFNSVQHHIGSTDKKLQALGMITAETVLGIAESSLKEEEKLKFDYSTFDASTNQQVVDVIREFLGNADADNFNNDDGTKAIEKLQEIAESRETLNICQPKVQEVPRKVQPQPKKALDSDDDDDDSQSPLDPDNHYPKPDESKRPRYLLDLIQAFTSKESLEDAEKFEYSMSSAEEIIKQQLPSHHTDIAVDLLKILISLEKACYMENFEELKMKILVEICSVHPKECAQYLCQEFNSEATKYTKSRRMFMLDVLAEVAKNISKLDVPKIEEDEKKPSAIPAKNKLLIKLNEELENRNKRDAQRIIRQRLLAKTRRIATRTKAPDENAGVNRFSSVVSHFFFPLIHGFGRKQMVFKSGTNLRDDIDNILLVKFLNTISVMLLCAENSAMAPKMAKEMMNLSVFLRYHEESKIRLAVLHMVATILLTIPRNVLIAQFSAEFNEFINHLGKIVKSSVVNYEADHECREFAKQLMGMLSNALD